MREEVCIVLNEREEAKAKVAAELQALLDARGTLVSRVEVKRGFEKVILEKKPAVLVTDYLLGDYSTGLDLLAQIQELPEHERPLSIFLTDEPSLQVAVSAMKLGALDYIQLDNPEAAQLVTQMVSDQLEAALVFEPPEPQTAARLETLVAEASNTRDCLTRARTAAASDNPVIMIIGPSGCGRSTMAHGIHLAGSSESLFNSIRLDYCERSISALISTERSVTAPDALASYTTLEIDHIESDQGELLDLVFKHFKTLWPNGSAAHNHRRLILGSTDPETYKAWRRLLPSIEVISIPALEDRKEDIPPLITRFHRQVNELANLKVKPIDAKVALKVADKEWPGDIRQLKSVLCNSIIASTLESTDLVDIIDRERETWLEQFYWDTTEPPSAIHAAQMLRATGYNYRITAVRLGYPVPYLRQLLVRSNDSEDCST